MDKISFTHRVDLSFLKHGFVISKSDLQNNQAFVDSAVEKNLQIKVILKAMNTLLIVIVHLVRKDKDLCLRLH